MMQSEAAKDHIKSLAACSDAREEIASTQFDGTTEDGQIVCSAPKRDVGEIIAEIPADRTSPQSECYMARATATKIEKRKRGVFITVGKEAFHITKYIFVVHIVVNQYLIIDRPLIEEIFRRRVRHSSLHRMLNCFYIDVQSRYRAIMSSLGETAKPQPGPQAYRM